MKAKEYVQKYGPRIMTGGPDAREAIVNMGEELLQEMVEINKVRYKSNQIHTSVIMEILDKWDAIAARINKAGKAELVDKDLLRRLESLAPYVENHKNEQVLQRMGHTARTFGVGSDKCSEILEAALEYTRAHTPRGNK